LADLDAILIANKDIVLIVDIQHRHLCYLSLSSRQEPKIEASVMQNLVFAFGPDDSYIFNTPKQWAQ